MNRLIIIGASGHGKVVADIAEKNGYTDIALVDDNEAVTECAGLPVIGTTALLPSLAGTCDFIVAIGNAKIRQRSQESLTGNIFTPHPASCCYQHHLSFTKEHIAWSCQIDYNI